MACSGLADAVQADVAVVVAVAMETAVDLQTSLPARAARLALDQLPRHPTKLPQLFDLHLFQSSDCVGAGVVVVAGRCVAFGVLQFFYSS